MMYGINLTRHEIILGMQEMKVNFHMYQKCMQVKTCTKLTLEKAENELFSWSGNMKLDFGEILEPLFWKIYRYNKRPNIIKAQLQLYKKEFLYKEFILICTKHIPYRFGMVTGIILYKYTWFLIIFTCEMILVGWSMVLITPWVWSPYGSFT